MCIRRSTFNIFLYIYSRSKKDMSDKRVRKTADVFSAPDTQKTKKAKSSTDASLANNEHSLATTTPHSAIPADLHSRRSPSPPIKGTIAGMQAQISLLLETIAALSRAQIAQPPVPSPVDPAPRALAFAEPWLDDVLQSDSRPTKPSSGLGAIEIRPAVTVCYRRIMIREITLATVFNVLEISDRCVEISDIFNEPTGKGQHRQLWYLWVADEDSAIQVSVWAPLGEPSGEPTLIPTPAASHRSSHKTKQNIS